MSIITNAQPVPNRVRILWKFLFDKGPNGALEKVIKELIAPTSLHSDGSVSTLLPNTIYECEALGLIVKEKTDDGAILKLTDYPDCSGTSWKSVFLSRVESLLLDDEKVEQRGQKWVPIAFAWLVNRDSKQPLPWRMNPNPELTEEFGVESEAFGLSNNAAFQTFVYWAHFLGFCNRIKVNNERYVIPDPTEAILRHLPEVFSAAGRLTGSDFITRVGELCPILETGVFREKLYGMSSKNYPWGASQFCPSTCLAVERLRQRGKVSLETADDAPTVSLAMPVNDQVVFTHISYGG